MQFKNYILTIHRIYNAMDYNNNIDTLDTFILFY